MTKTEALGIVQELENRIDELNGYSSQVREFVEVEIIGHAEANETTVPAGALGSLASVDEVHMALAALKDRLGELTQALGEL